MRFESPYFLLLLLLTPMFLGMLSRRARKVESSISFVSPLPLKKLAGTGRARWAEPLLRALRTATFVLIVIALARPQLGLSFREIEASGRDILLVLDLSGSMQAMDFIIDGERVSRLDALKHVVKRFIDDRQGDRLGLIVFGNQVFTQCPLTLDHGVLKSFVDRLEIGMAGEGTALGDVIALATKQIRNIESKSRVIVLVTDGKNTAGSLSPLQTSEVAGKLGVTIHVVGIGGNEAAPFPVKGFLGQTRLVNIQMEYDEETLRTIARFTHGQYFNAKDTAGLEQIYREIDKLEERLEKSYEYVEYEERYPPLVIVALILIVTAVLLRVFVFVKIP